MRKQEQEALRRLEAALLAQEQPEEETVTDEDFPEELWQEVSGGDYDIYNTDAADVDLDAYSEDVHRGRQSSGFLSLLVAVSILLLVFAIGILLKFLGVI